MNWPAQIGCPQHHPTWPRVNRGFKSRPALNFRFAASYDRRPWSSAVQGPSEDQAARRRRVRRDRSLVTPMGSGRSSSSERACSTRSCTSALPSSDNSAMARTASRDSSIRRILSAVVMWSTVRRAKIRPGNAELHPCKASATIRWRQHAPEPSTAPFGAARHCGPVPSMDSGVRGGSGSVVGSPGGSHAWR